ncbi:putative glycerophosphoryl diester phosphodiesterase 1 [compost metagenome]
MTSLPLVIGHRGAGGHAPENTLAAFRLGLSLGADGVECDVHMSQDGQLVVIHDAMVDRTTSGKGRVGTMPFEALRQLDAGSWFDPRFEGERLPSLEEVFGVVRKAEWESGKERWLFVELKHGDETYPGIEDTLVRAIARSGLSQRIGVISFDHRAIARIQALEPGIRTGVLYDARPVDSVSLAKAAGAGWIGPAVKWVDDAEVSSARRAGLEVFVWTANQEDAMRRVLELGVTAVGSDYPDRLLAMRANTRFSPTNSF